MVNKDQTDVEETTPEFDESEGEEEVLEDRAEGTEEDESPAEASEEVVKEASDEDVEEPVKEASVPTVEEQLEHVETQNKELQDRLLRLNAEFENYKKRIAKENIEKFKYYHTGLIKELLPALDSLERALEHGQKENVTIEAMLEGIDMVYKLHQEAFEKFSVSKVKAIGEPFDPTVHQAVGTVESDTVPEDHVVDQFQVGYLLHDRMIRPAMVRVSKKQ